MADFTIAPWNGVFVSARTPPATVERLRALMLQTLKSPAYAANTTKRARSGFHVCGDALGKFQRDEMDKARKVLKTAGIEPQ